MVGRARGQTRQRLGHQHARRAARPPFGRALAVGDRGAVVEEVGGVEAVRLDQPVDRRARSGDVARGTGCACEATWRVDRRDGAGAGEIPADRSERRGVEGRPEHPGVGPGVEDGRLPLVAQPGNDLVLIAEIDELLRARVDVPVVHVHDVRPSRGFYAVDDRDRRSAGRRRRGGREGAQARRDGSETEQRGEAASVGAPRSGKGTWPRKALGVPLPKIGGGVPGRSRWQTGARAGGLGP